MWHFEETSHLKCIFIRKLFKILIKLICLTGFGLLAFIKMAMKKKVLLIIECVDFLPPNADGVRFGI